MSIVSCAIVMPAWNEAEGIVGFLNEIATELKSVQPVFVVVDDCSTDLTFHALQAESIVANYKIIVLRNAENLGHGASTIRALRAGCQESADLIVAIDGDGQFLGSDVARLVDQALTGEFDVVEGVRTSRDDPWFRRTVSMATRILVWSRSGAWPADANTPLRVYSPNVLAQILSSLPESLSVPNLVISAASRKSHLALLESEVRSIPRRGLSSTGSTWGKGKKFVPNRKFVKFCANATKQWSTTRIPKIASERSGL